MSERDRRALPPWLPTAGIAAALAALVAWSFWQRWSALTASPFPLGIDGYFYPVQLRSLLDHGTLEFPASPLAFWLLAPFAAATDPIIGAKLGSAALCALIALPAYAVGAHLGRDGDDDGRGPGLIAATLSTTSAGSLYLTVEFVKNGIGLTIALTALWLVLRALAIPTCARIAAAIGGIAAAVLTHKMAAALVVGIAIPAALAEAHVRARAATAEVRARRRLWILGALALVGGTLLAIGLLSPRRFVSPADLALLDGLFTSDADWTLPVLDNQLRLGWEPLIGLVLAAVAAAALIVDRGSARTDGSTGRAVVGWSVVALAIFIGLPWLDTTSTLGLAMRIRVIAFVPLALCAAIVLRVGLRYAMPLFRGPRKPTRLAVCATIAVGIVALHAGDRRTEGQILAHPALVAGALALNGRLPDGAVAIVPERHIAFMIAWYARVPVSTRPDGIPEQRRWRVLPGNYIKRGDSLETALIQIRARTDLPRVIGLHPGHPSGMVAIPEPTWHALQELLSDEDRALFAIWPTL